MKLFVQFGCFKENFHSAIVENAEMIPTNFIPTVVSANQHAMVGFSKTNQEQGLYPKCRDFRLKYIPGVRIPTARILWHPYLYRTLIRHFYSLVRKKIPSTALNQQLLLGSVKTNLLLRMAVSLYFIQQDFKGKVKYVATSK